MNSNKLISLRENLNMTQEDMAKVAGVKQSTYSDWENGYSIIPLKRLNAISNKFNVSLNYLTGLSLKNDPDFDAIELDKVKIGNRLKQVRLRNNLRQVDIAQMLNTTHSTVSAFESGKTLILTAFIIEFSKITNSSIDYLCCKTDKTNIL